MDCSTITSTVIQKWSRLCAELEEKISVFGKTGAQLRRTGAYKKAKIVDWNKWFGELSQVNLEFDNLHITNSPDPCYITKTNEARQLHTTYLSELQAISENEEDTEQNTGESTDGRAIANGLQVN